MGLSPFGRCYTNPSASAPNPDDWMFIDCHQYKKAYVLVIRYRGCTNYEGKKVMVYRGNWQGSSGQRLDPHFADNAGSPIARFKPDSEGISNAKLFAKNIS